MGFFDRFKKNGRDTVQIPQTTNFTNEPLILRHSDGKTVDELYFSGMREILGKQVHVISRKDVSYHGGVDKYSTFYIEPIMGYSQDGSQVDITESKLREWGKEPNPGEDRRAFIAVKGFFKREEITKEKMGSNYIGGLRRREDGSFYRYMDEEFRARLIENERKVEEKSENNFAQNLKDITTDPTAYFASEEARRNPLTKEDYEMYMANRNNNEFGAR